MVQEIDFLPESYHTKRRHGRMNIWRRGILVVFLLIIGTSTLQQHYEQQKRELNRDRVLQRAANLIAQLENADALRRKIELAEAKANLLTILRLQVPPTRILAAVTSNLPEFVTLTELHTTYEKVAPSNVLPRKIRRNKAVQENSAEPGEIIDLKQLKSQRKETAMYVSLKGVAPNDVVVARFLASLQETDVFDEAVLEITEGSLYQGYQLRRFSVRLKVSRLEDRTRMPRNAKPPSQPVPEPAFAESPSRNERAVDVLDKPATIAERTTR